MNKIIGWEEMYIKTIRGLRLDLSWADISVRGRGLEQRSNLRGTEEEKTGEIVCMNAINIHNIGTCLFGKHVLSESTYTVL